MQKPMSDRWISYIAILLIAAFLAGGAFLAYRYELKQWDIIRNTKIIEQPGR